MTDRAQGDRESDIIQRSNTVARNTAGSWRFSGYGV